MPMYEYDCADCHQSFEELVFAEADRAAVSCPACASLRVSRKLSAFAVGAGGTAQHADFASGSSCASGGCCGGSCG